MRRSKRNIQEEKEQGPDCSICIHRTGCEQYEEDSLCGRFQRRKPEPAGPDPNDLWERGEEVEF